MAFLMPHELTLTEGASNNWTAKVPAGVTLERMQDPIYWTHVGDRLRQWDTIRAQYLASDGMWFAEFIVTAVDDEKRTWAKVKLLRHKILVEGETAIVPEKPMEHPDFEVKYRGTMGWSVLRKDGKNTVMFDRSKHPDDANRWIREYQKKTAA